MVREAGADGVAVISAICQSLDRHTTVSLLNSSTVVDPSDLTSNSLK